MSTQLLSTQPFIGFLLAQITWLHVLTRILDIFRPVCYTKNKK